jgi:hypothetical protein
MIKSAEILFLHFYNSIVDIVNTSHFLSVFAQLQTFHCLNNIPSVLITFPSFGSCNLPIFSGTNSGINGELRADQWDLDSMTLAMLANEVCQPQCLSGVFLFSVFANTLTRFRFAMRIVQDWNSYSNSLNSATIFGLKT